MNAPSNAKRKATHKVRPGGLMRCCNPQTIQDRIDEDRPPEEGEVLTCSICDGKIIFRVLVLGNG
jgi:hypothetical protein